ncbi:ribbon-helix-helix protein, CopG family [Asticcacaulis sp. BYS171W]|uniref:Ribbon-helix-helix protein, CopG family n=1 Tax=Asticcacaulis aquaticus TaxID=2984212 RepID=A0ABT5HT11_9CAUL|nr:ribbon-helix-helix protein, CopG family [Asticcacaulis aquaticus]MDC7683093.1 ribbon-helix-helix protein, CopG family [Asticcacaulis aquaticus]
MRYNISLEESVAKILDAKADELGLSRSAYISQLVMKNSDTHPYSYALYKFQAAIRRLMCSDSFPIRMQKARENLSGLIYEQHLPPKALARFKQLEEIISEKAVDDGSGYGSWFTAAKNMDDFEEAEILNGLSTIYSELIELSS